MQLFSVLLYVSKVLLNVKFVVGMQLCSKGLVLKHFNVDLKGVCFFKSMKCNAITTSY